MKIKKCLPSLGMRTIKTIIAVLITWTVCSYFGRDASVACLCAVSGVGCSVFKSLKRGLIDAAGTVVACCVAAIIIVLYNLTLFTNIPFGIYIVLGIPVVIYFEQLINKSRDAEMALTIYLFVVICAPTDAYFMYGLNRILDTIIGFIIGILVNTLAFPSPEDVEQDNKSVIGTVVSCVQGQIQKKKQDKNKENNGMGNENKNKENDKEDKKAGEGNDE